MVLCVNSTVTVTQGQALGNGSIISAMETNVQLMDIQIRLVHELTALQASMQPNHPHIPSEASSSTKSLTAVSHALCYAAAHANMK